MSLLIPCWMKSQRIDKYYYGQYTVGGFLGLN